MPISIFSKLQSRRFRKLALPIFFCIFLLNFAGIFVFGYFYFYGVDKNQVILMIPKSIRNGAQTIIKRLQNLPYLPYEFLPDGLPVYEIQIDQKDLASLNKDLTTALKNAIWLDAGKLKYQEAKFSFNGQKYEVEVKYRGMGGWHWMYPQKSWRIKLKKNAGTFEGMKEMNLIVPYDRRYIAEEFNNWRAKKLGLKVPASKFVELKVNGVSNGVYFLTESLGPEFLEKAGLDKNTNFYTEKTLGTPIFDDVKYWKKISANPNEPVDNYAELNQLLELIKSDDAYFSKNVWNLIDKDNFMKWYVHSILSGSIHQEKTHNALWYFNPALGKFQLIPCDVGIQNTIVEQGLNINYHPLVTRLLKNPNFILDRNRALWDYVKDENNLKEDLKQFDAIYKQVRIAFYQDKMREWTNKFFDQTIAGERQLIEDTFNSIKKAIKNSELNANIILNPGRNKNLLRGTRVPLAFELEANDASPLLFKSINIRTIDPETKSNFHLYYDSNNNGFLDANDKWLGRITYNNKEYVAANFNLRLQALLQNPDSDNVAMKVAPQKYRFFLLPEQNINGNIKNVKLEFGVDNYITGEYQKISNKIYLDNSVIKNFD